ncbi:FG-GAP repeat protein [Ancylostoma caninum]|uniref:FG-GAP repeat protein n=1 Tax=Ancylostoma caninum TaxID=29170 RepID=A0A368GUI3_ANCCA|nr:FG-GAP repeat protein [Ancylostoma caninum]
MTEEAEEEVVSNDSFELASLFSFSLNQRILPRCATSARIEPDSRETLVAVSASNKVILRSNESSLHIPDKIKCITTVPFGMGYDYIVVGTESQVLVYDFHQNSTVFRRDVPDGVHCFAVGKIGDLDRMILCGGNCAIWGFDETGKDVYWTVTGDAVTTMCFCDFDGDGEMELIIGSPDSELRIFKNDLMRAELLETDAVIVLQGFDRNRFGYALANGTVGMYHQDQRLWRIKSKSVITAILPYPNNDMITCVWSSGKIDVRSINENGEVVCRDSTLTGQTVIAGFTSMMNNDDELEFTVVTAEGKVHGYNNSKPKELVDKTQETLHLFGQKKHNLLIELSNFEQEEQLSESEKEKDFRIPIGTSVECKLFVSKSDRNLYLVLEASHEVCIRGVIAFAEGLFEGESYIWIPKLIEGNGDRVQIPIITEKDMANEIHIRTFLGPQES